MPHIPVHPSAQKRQRQNLKRREHNHAAKTKVRTIVKTAAESIAGKDSAAGEKLRDAISALDKAASKGIIHRNQAARRKSRLMAKLNKMGAAS